MRRTPWGLWAVVGLIMLTSSAVTASVLPSDGKGRRNPRTGKLIVTRSGNVLSPEALRQLVVTMGFADVDAAVAIANRESGRDAGIVLDTRGMTPDELFDYWKLKARPELSVGLWQINLLANAALVPGDSLDEKVRFLQSPSGSAVVALKLSRGGTSWGPWGGKPRASS